MVTPATVVSIESNWVFLGFPCGSAGKECACTVCRPGFDPWVGKMPWRRERLSGLENSMDCKFHEVAKGQT